MVVAQGLGGVESGWTSLALYRKPWCVWCGPVLRGIRDENFWTADSESFRLKDLVSRNQARESALVFNFLFTYSCAFPIMYLNPIHFLSLQIHPLLLQLPLTINFKRKKEKRKWGISL